MKAVYAALSVLLLGCSSGGVTGEPLEPLSPHPMAVRTAVLL